MESRTLGATGLQVTRMGLGLAALGRPAYINIGHADDLDRDYDVEAMRAALCAAMGLGSMPCQITYHLAVCEILGCRTTATGRQTPQTRVAWPSVVETTMRWRARAGIVEQRTVRDVTVG